MLTLDHSRRFNQKTVYHCVGQVLGTGRDGAILGAAKGFHPTPD